jgi:hypothetical protein
MDLIGEHDGIAHQRKKPPVMSRELRASSKLTVPNQSATKVAMARTKKPALG